MPMETAPVVGIPSKTAWSSTAIRRTPQAEVYVACGFSGTEEAPRRGREFIHYLEQQSFSSPAEAYQQIKEYYQQINSGVAASISLVFRQEKKIILISFGYGLIGLLRANQSRWLLDGSDPEQVLEGELKPGDQLVLSTARATEIMSDLSFWQNTQMDDVALELIDRVRNNPNPSEFAFLLLGWQPTVNQDENDSENDFSDAASDSPSLSPSISPSLLLDSSDSPDLPASKSMRQTSQSATTNFSSKPNSAHLISPDKLAAGIVATQQEQQAIQQRSSSPRFNYLQIVTKLRDIAWLRVAILVVFLLFVLGGLLLWRYRNINLETKQVIAPLEQQTNELQQISDEDRLAKRDAAKSMLEKLQATSVKYRTNRYRLIELTTQMQELYESLSGEKQVADLEVFFDFRLVASKFLARRADRTKDQAVFLDPNEKKIIALNLENKNNRTVTDDLLADSFDVVALENDARVLKNNEVLFVAYSGSKTEPVLDTEDVAQAAFMERFGDNLYVLDKQKQQVWRLAGGLEADSQASPSGWVRSAAGVVFDQTSSLTIDGDVWLGSNQGEIYRLRRGERVSFKVEGLLEPFTSTLLLAAAPEADKLVVVEPASKRLVVLNKEGVYQQQIVSDQIGGVTDVFLSSDETRAFLVAGSVVYVVEI